MGPGQASLIHSSSLFLFLLLRRQLSFPSSSSFLFFFYFPSFSFTYSLIFLILFLFFIFLNIRQLNAYTVLRISFPSPPWSSCYSWLCMFIIPCSSEPTVFTHANCIVIPSHPVRMNSSILFPTFSEASKTTRISDFC